MRKSPLEKAIEVWEKKLAIAIKEKGQPIHYEGAAYRFGESLFEIGSSHCPLCVNGCEKCPVQKKTKNGCVETPYFKVLDLLFPSRGLAVTSKLIKAIESEVTFLKSLRRT